jgi:cysteine desulfurase
MKPICLDYNATTPIAPAVLSAMLPCLREAFGNPSPAHARLPIRRNAISTPHELNT